MRKIGRESEIERLMQIPTQIRNICIIAHVDHGKTTLSDCLLASNHIISEKQAGKLRLLDGRKDEQKRQITMKTSAVSILHTFNSMRHKQLPGKALNSRGEEENKVDNEKNNEYVINFMDSPGHVDFSFEVSAALTLSDGGIILVDALEGVCQQTRTVIRQAWEERVATILLINKIDKLIVELEKSPDEVYILLQNIIEDVNSIVGSLFMGDLNEEEGRSRYKGLNEEELGKVEEKIYFSPEKLNVIFASSLDNWGFTLKHFAIRLAKKLGNGKFKPQMLAKCLWGEYYYNTSKEKIFTSADKREDRPMFINYVLTPICEEYKILIRYKESQDSQEYREKRREIADKLKHIMPLHSTVLDTVITKLPNPMEGQKTRCRTLCPMLYEKGRGKRGEEWRIIRESVENCRQGIGETIVVYISKMMPLEESMQREIMMRENTSIGISSMKSIAFGKVMSGTLRRGQKVYIIPPRHNPGNTSSPPATVTLNHLFLFMGMSIIPVESIPAGNIVGVGGISLTISKTCVLSTSPFCPPFLPLRLKNNPIVQVAIEPVNLHEMGILENGLEMLNRSDPSVQIFVSSQGEQILIACGEVHLQRCIKDLKNYFAKIKISVSEPIINIKETIVLRTLIGSKYKSSAQNKISEHITNPANIQQIDNINRTEDIYLEHIKELSHTQGQADSKSTKLGYAEGTAHIGTYTYDIRLTVRAVGLHYNITKFLMTKHKLITLLNKLHLRNYLDPKNNNKSNASRNLRSIKKARNFVKEFHNLLIEYNTPKKLINMIIGYTLVFGPKRVGPNILVFRYMLPTDSLLFDFLYMGDGDQINKYINLDKQLEEKVVIGKVDEIFTQEKNEDIVPIELNQEIRGKEEEEKEELAPKESGEEESKNEQSYYLYYHKKLKEEMNSFPVTELKHSLISGFELATWPLSEDEMVGACFIVDDIAVVKCEHKEIMLPKIKEIPQNSIEKNEDSISSSSEEELEEGMIFSEKYWDEENWKGFYEEEKDGVGCEADVKDKIENTLEESKEEEKKNITKSVPITLQLMATMQDVCKKSFMRAHPRIVEPLYICSLQLTPEMLGKIYPVLTKRRGKMLSEQLLPETNYFEVKVLLPVVESFNLADELSNKSEGIAYPQLVFSHWEILDEDPFYIPRTEEDLEEFGAQILAPNKAKLLLTKNRKRKGLPLEQKIVNFAEKQRTLTKMK